MISESIELEQDARRLAPPDAPPAQSPGDTSGRGRLHLLSVEHQAMALALTPKQLRLVLMLGRDRTDRQIAYGLSVSPHSVSMVLAHVRRLTGMSRLGLAVMGYLLRQAGFSQPPCTASPLETRLK